MKNLLKKLQEPPVIIEIYSDKMIFTVLDYKGDEKKQVTIKPEKPYTSERMLIGHFENAEACMKNAMKQLGYNTLKKPPVIIKPKEKLEGGLSLIEKRALTELAELSGGVSIEVIVA